jgi:hypothetical protein
VRVVDDRIGLLEGNCIDREEGDLEAEESTGDWNTANEACQDERESRAPIAPFFFRRRHN